MNWRDAITDDHDRLDTGRLSMFLVMWVVLGAIPVMVAGAVAEAWTSEHHVFPYAELGKGIGLATTAFGAALYALGQYVKQDKQPTAPLPPADPTYRG